MITIKKAAAFLFFFVLFFGAVCDKNIIYPDITAAFFISLMHNVTMLTAPRIGDAWFYPSLLSVILVPAALHTWCFPRCHANV